MPHSSLVITLFRLIFLSPQVASAEPNPLLRSLEGSCLQSFCKACSLIQPSDSRDHAYLGLIALLNVDPQVCPIRRLLHEIFDLTKVLLHTT